MPYKRNFPKTLRSQWLGIRLRTIRDRRGLTLKDVAGFLGVDFSTLARYERAEWPVQLHHVVAMLDLYGVSDEKERTVLIETARHAWRVNRWDADTETADFDLPFIGYTWVQQRAAEICTYSTVCVPALLQTREYADALTRASDQAPLPDYKIANMVRDRVETQAILDSTPPVQVTAVIEEPALRRPVGGATVLRGQLEHLIELAHRPNVQVHVLPETVGEHPALDGAFTLLRMREDYPPVAYLEHLGGRLFVETGRAARYAKAHDLILDAAMSPSLSAVRIAELAKAL